MRLLERDPIHSVSLSDLRIADWVRAGDLVTWGQACGEPVELTRRLFESRHGIGEFRCFIGLCSPDTAVRVEQSDVVAFYSYIGGGVGERLYAAGNLQIVPVNYSALPKLLSEGRLKTDVTLVQVAALDDPGQFSLGMTSDYVLAAAKASRTVIAIMSPNVPATHGAAISRGDIDVLVHADSVPISWSEPRIPTEAQRTIATLVSDLIDDGSTIQIGIGGLPDAVLAELIRHSDLGVHSGVLTDGMLDLVEAGAITNRKKSVDAGLTVAAFALGGERMRRFLHRRSDIELREASYTHDPEVLAAQHQLVAINSALEVDLTGQINTESVRGRYLGGVGGGADFLRGAARSRGGLPIVVLESQAGDASRIVAKLSASVSTPRSDVGLVVTELGVADLRGASTDERVDLMIGLAPESHRDRLHGAWIEESNKRTYRSE